MTSPSTSQHESEINLNKNDELGNLFSTSAANDSHSNFDEDAQNIANYESDSLSSDSDAEARAKIRKEMNARFAKAKKAKKTSQNLLQKHLI